MGQKDLLLKGGYTRELACRSHETVDLAPLGTTTTVTTITTTIIYNYTPTPQLSSNTRIMIIYGHTSTPQPKNNAQIVMIYAYTPTHQPPPPFLPVSPTSCTFRPYPPLTKGAHFDRGWARRESRRSSAERIVRGGR